MGEVMKMAGSDDGVFGVSKHSPLVIRQDSLPFTIVLGALEGSRRLELNAELG